MFERWATTLLTRAGVVLNGSRPFDPQVKNSRVFRRVFLWGSLGLGDAYVDGDWECEQLDVFFETIIRSGVDTHASRFIDAIESARNRFLNLQSVQRALHVAEHHYDLGNKLYEHVLGESMAYSAGYFKNGANDLASAQHAKFDLICKKLDLKAGMKVLEIGCGWGTFAAYAARTYGVSVLAVTVSKEQLAYAKVKCAGLPVSFYFGDYRTIPTEHVGTCDRVVSIEMVEAVGTKNLRSYMGVAAQMLAADGQFLLQAIVGSGIPDAWLSTRIFPNGVLPSHEHIQQSVDDLFTIVDTESFGDDYDRTLMAWDERFRAAWPTIRELKDAHGKALYDERFYRMWRYYLLVCAGAFRAGKITVTQYHLAKV